MLKPEVVKGTIQERTETMLVGKDRSREETLERILDYLNKKKIRATYGSVAPLLNTHPLSVGKYLGKRRPRASWVVNKNTGKPTGYSEAEMHESLFDNRKVISSTDELCEAMRKHEGR